MSPFPTASHGLPPIAWLDPFAIPPVASVAGVGAVTLAVVVLWRWRAGAFESGHSGVESKPVIATDGIGETLVSDTDEVHDLLEANDGRMRQTEIVDETGWSKAKVSTLLSKMERVDDVTKLRVGRENIVSLPGREPEATGSPFEE